MSGPIAPGLGEKTVSVRVLADADAATLQAWDEFVRKHAAGDVAQLSGWARVRAEAGFSSLLVLAHRGEELAGGALVLLRRIPVLGSVGYVAYGPLVDDGDDAGTVAEAVAEALGMLARTQLRMLFVQPPADATQVADALVVRGFRPSDAGIAPRASVHVDLGRDEDELRKNLSRRLREWTNRWPRVGVEVRTGVEADLPRVAELLAQTGDHHGYTAFSLEYLQCMYRELVPTGDLQVFVGEVAGRPVAAAVHTTCGDAVKVRLVGFDRDSEASKLNVPAAIDWTAMRWAKTQGFRWFDHGGLSEVATELVMAGGDVDVEQLTGPDRHKLKFGGEAFRYPEPLELISSPLLRFGYDLARRSAGGRFLVDRAKRLARTGAFLRRRSSSDDVLPTKGR